MVWVYTPVRSMSAWLWICEPLHNSVETGLPHHGSGSAKVPWFSSTAPLSKEPVIQLNLAPAGMVVVPGPMILPGAYMVDSPVRVGSPLTTPSVTRRLAMLDPALASTRLDSASFTSVPGPVTRAVGPSANVTGPTDGFG